MRAVCPGRSNWRARAAARRRRSLKVQSRLVTRHSCSGAARAAARVIASRRTCDAVAWMRARRKPGAVSVWAHPICSGYSSRCTSPKRLSRPPDHAGGTLSWARSSAKIITRAVDEDAADGEPAEAAFGRQQWTLPRQSALGVAEPAVVAQAHQADAGSPAVGGVAVGAGRAEGPAGDPAAVDLGRAGERGAGAARRVGATGRGVADRAGHGPAGARGRGAAASRSATVVWFRAASRWA